MFLGKHWYICHQTNFINEVSVTQTPAQVFHYDSDKKEVKLCWEEGTCFVGNSDSSGRSRGNLPELGNPKETSREIREGCENLVNSEELTR